QDVHLGAEDLARGEAPFEGDRDRSVSAEIAEEKAQILLPEAGRNLLNPVSVAVAPSRDLARPDLLDRACIVGLHHDGGDVHGPEAERPSDGLEVHAPVLLPSAQPDAALPVRGKRTRLAHGN